MGGTWTNQNKILPGAYLNFRTNAPLSITLGERGTVVILQEVSKGASGEMYKITALDQSKWPTGVTAEDKLLANEALKGANTVIVYNLGAEHTSEVVEQALAKLMTEDFNVLVYPYDGAAYDTIKTTIKAWVDMMRTEEARKFRQLWLTLQLTMKRLSMLPKVLDLLTEQNLQQHKLQHGLEVLLLVRLLISLILDVNI